MKANEAPKSKFIYPNKLYARCKDNKTLDISYAPQNMEAVEYTRTDAFIEKACEYINKLIDIPHSIECADNGEPLADSYIDYAKERLEVANKIIEDFRKYMEGE